MQVNRNANALPVPFVLALLLAVASLVMAAQALAASPKKGAHFKGATSSALVNNFPAPVTFTVSSDGKKLTGFKYSSFGCFGAGGFRAGIDYYTMPFAVMKVGTVKVSKGGHFSVSGASSTYEAHGQKTVTTSKVTGHFSKAKVASGAITFSQKVTGSFNSNCGPGTVTFTAAAK
ncbi:MAG TPA: hypothetical protein VH025_11310 [Solirubrobacteraceae bacterium]|jgi:hypothetical protein|nr:hypothetical protein [Solirubrobacteraceae bacterium]